MKIYCHGFWNGFYNCMDCNNFNFLKMIFKKFNEEIIVEHDINKADIYIDTVFGSHPNIGKIKIPKIHFTGENRVSHNKIYDIVLSGIKTKHKKKQIDLPLCIWYIHNNMFLDRLRNPSMVQTIPEKFCIFMVSSSFDTNGCKMRENFFLKLSEYKHIDSFGKIHRNNFSNTPKEYWSEDYFALLKQYKFIISMENTKISGYITEKIVNPLIANIIPIYYGSDTVSEIFNDERILTVKDDNDIEQIINTIKKIDLDDMLYLNIVNKPIFKNNEFPKKYELSNIQNEIFVKITQLVPEKYSSHTPV